MAVLLVAGGIVALTGGGGSDAEDTVDTDVMGGEAADLDDAGVGRAGVDGAGAEGPSATTNPPRPTPTTNNTTPRDPEEVALEELAELAGAGESRFVADGRWVVQLASKWPGVVDGMLVAANGTSTFHAVDILQEHEELRRRFGSDVIMVRSTVLGRQSTYPGKPPEATIWVTLLDPGFFLGEDDAQAWCDAEFSFLAGDARRNSCLVREAVPPHA